MAELFNAKWIEKLPVPGRNAFVSLAKYLEQAERFDCMAACMKKVTEFDQELNNEERNLISVAFKNVVGSRRNAYRVLSNHLTRTQESEKVAIIKSYRAEIQKELNDICSYVLKLIEERLLGLCSNAEGKVFYQKMMGDYYRYMAENANLENHKKIVEDSLNAYRQATEIAEAELDCTHPIRLGLALNYSVFHYEIMNSPDTACQLAKKAFEDAVQGVANTKNDSYKDSTLIMQLLRDNLTLWTSDSDEPENECAE